MNPKKFANLKMTVLILALILSLIPLGLVSAREGIDAALSATDDEFTVGDLIPLKLTVNHPNGYRLLPLQLQDSTWGAFEVRELVPSQVTANPDGTETTTQTIYAILWAPGEYITPELVLGVSDTSGEIHEISVASVDLSVTSVLVEGDSELRDIKPQASLPLPAIWPWVVGGLLLALVIFIFFGWYARRWWLSRQDALANAPDLRLPFEVAFDELAHIEDLNLPSQRRFKEHYTLISDVLRIYIENSFQIPTLDRTTGEIRCSLKMAPFSQDNKRLLVEMLNEADMVKFAKVRPEVLMAQNYLVQARRFVGETQPPKVVTGNGNGQNPHDHNKTDLDFQLKNTPLTEAK